MSHDPLDSLLPPLPPFTDLFSVQATIIEMVARDWKVWMGSKPFVGFAFGFACTALVIYNSEIAPVKLRGFLLSTWALGFAFGQFMASIALQIIASVSNTYYDRKYTF